MNLTRILTQTNFWNCLSHFVHFEKKQKNQKTEKNMSNRKRELCRRGALLPRNTLTNLNEASSQATDPYCSVNSQSSCYMGPQSPEIRNFKRAKTGNKLCNDSIITNRPPKLKIVATSTHTTPRLALSKNSESNIGNREPTLKVVATSSLRTTISSGIFKSSHHLSNETCKYVITIEPENDLPTPVKNSLITRRSQKLLRDPVLLSSASLMVKPLYDASTVVVGSKSSSNSTSRPIKHDTGAAGQFEFINTYFTKPVVALPSADSVANLNTSFATTISDYDFEPLTSRTRIKGLATVASHGVRASRSGGGRHQRIIISHEPISLLSDDENDEFSTVFDSRVAALTLPPSIEFHNLNWNDDVPCGNFILSVEHDVANGGDVKSQLFLCISGLPTAEAECSMNATSPVAFSTSKSSVTIANRPIRGCRLESSTRSTKPVAIDLSLLDSNRPTPTLLLSSQCHILTSPDPVSSTPEQPTMATNVPIWQRVIKKAKELFITPILVFVGALGSLSAEAVSHHESIAMVEAPRTCKIMIPFSHLKQLHV